MDRDAPLPEITRDDRPADFAIRLRLLVFPSQRAAARCFDRAPGTISRYENEGLTPPLGYLAGLLTCLLDQRARLGRPAAALEADQRFLLEQLHKLIAWFPENYKYQKPLRSWPQVLQAAEQYRRTPSGGPDLSPTPAPAEAAPDPRPRPAGFAPAACGPPPALAGPITAFQVPYPRNPLFVGRADVLAHLDTALGSGAVVALAGIGGVGKTQVALEYAYCARAQYPGGVFWLTMDQPDGIANQVAACAGPEGIALPGWDPRHFAYNLASVRTAWQAPIARLLIFDNLEDPAVLAQWRPRIGGSRVLLTTRRATWSASTGVPVVGLAPLPRHASQTALLLPRARAQGREVADLLADPATAAQADALCDLLGDLPLAVALAGSYLETYPTLPLERYRTQLVTEPVTHPSLNTAPDDGLPTGHAPSVSATFSLSYAQLDGARPADARAGQLLQRSARCAPTPLPTRLLARLAGQAPDDPALPEHLMPVLRRLAALGLLDLLPGGEAHLHRLLAAFVRQRAADPAGEEASVAEALLAEVTAMNRASPLAVGAAYLAHLRYLLDQQHGLPDRVVGHLHLQAGELLYRMGDLVGARAHYEQALGHYARAGGEADPDALNSRIRLARVARHQGDFAAARPLLEAAVQISEQQLGPAHALTAASLNQLAGLLRESREFAPAQQLAERGLAIREALHGGRHPDIADSLTNLGHILHAQGDMRGAQALFERSLRIREELLGAIHPDTATSWHNLGLVLHEAGNLAVAQVLYERALAIYEQTLGAAHPDAARTLANLARLWRDCGDPERAQSAYARALGMYEQALGPQHPLTEQTRAAARRVGGPTGQAAHRT